MKAVCDWCLTPIRAPNTYDPLQTAIYCGQHCLQKDWLFRRWQNDDYLNFKAKEVKDGKAQGEAD